MMFLIAVAGCTTSPREPGRVFDFGPAPVVQSDPIAMRIPEMEAPDWLDSIDIHYRLAYVDPRTLNSYALNRWAGTPASMLTLRFRQTIGDTDAASAKCALHLSLEEFSQVFTRANESRALLQLRADLRELRGQRRRNATVVRLERAAPTPNAAGAAAAFSALADEATVRLRTWAQDTGFCG